MNEIKYFKSRDWNHAGNGNWTKSFRPGRTAFTVCKWQAEVDGKPRYFAQVTDDGGEWSFRDFDDMQTYHEAVVMRCLAEAAAYELDIICK
jgi:hypothetical protein